MKHNLKSPCRECPYIGNIPGWIGAHRDAQEFVDLAKADARFPCHMTVDYGDPDWKTRVNDGNAEQCVGQLAFMNRDLKVSRTRAVAEHQAEIARDETIQVLWPPEHLVEVHRAGPLKGIKLRDAKRKADGK